MDLFSSARSEQDAGNYALAHSIVVETIREFENASINVSLQLRQTFVLLHSYIIVKALVRYSTRLTYRHSTQ